MANTRKHYRTWAAKPGNLQDKAQYAREGYRLLRSTGICVRCRREDAEPGKAACETCNMLQSEGRILARNLKRFWASRYSPGFEPCLLAHAFSGSDTRNPTQDSGC